MIYIYLWKSEIIRWKTIDVGARVSDIYLLKHVASLTVKSAKQ